MRLLLAAVLLFAATPAVAAAAPPNDNYLASVPLATDAQSTTSVDTTDATVQPDLFNFSSQGLPLGGGPPEPLDCKGTAFGKTVWYDIAPRVNYGVQLRAVAAFPVTLAVYQWDATTSRISRLVDCSANATADDLLLDLEAGKNYTLQVGGIAGVGGPLSVRAEFFADRDGDGVLDALDKCRTVAGTTDGCPPELRVVPAIGFSGTGDGIRITRLVVDRVPKGARVQARCSRGCGSQTVRAKRLGRVSLSRLVGRAVPAGATVQVRVTLGKTGSGRYRFGATGSSFAWPVRANGLGARQTRCLNVKSAKPERCR